MLYFLLLDSSPVLMMFGGISTSSGGLDNAEFLSDVPDVTERCFPPETFIDGGVKAQIEFATGIKITMWNSVGFA